MNGELAFSPAKMPGVDLVRVLNMAYERVQLFTSQLRRLIIVLYKKGDRLGTKNYRPISLLNVDYKIATRVISGRLLGVIGSVVGYDQTYGFLGRTISENLTLVRDLIEYADRTCRHPLGPSLFRSREGLRSG